MENFDDAILRILIIFSIMEFLRIMRFLRILRNLRILRILGMLRILGNKTKTQISHRTVERNSSETLTRSGLGRLPDLAIDGWEN